MIPTTSRPVRPVRAGVAQPSATCSCGASIRNVRVVSGPGRGCDIPIDIDRDPAGILTAARDGTDWGVRVLSDDQRLAATGHRYSPHWTTCPAAGQYAGLEQAVAPGTIRRSTAITTGGPDRSGPCARCRTRHPYRYGPGAASPLCDPCRVETGRPPIAPTAETP
jgi:hypothetical protein